MQHDFKGVEWIFLNLEDEIETQNKTRDCKSILTLSLLLLLSDAINIIIKFMNGMSYKEPNY